MHAVGAVEPMSGLYVPAGHFVHMPVPGSVAYVPVGQFVHCVDPCDEYSPDVHATQALALVAPMVVLAVPAGH